MTYLSCKVDDAGIRVVEDIHDSVRYINILPTQRLITRVQTVLSFLTKQRCRCVPNHKVNHWGAN